MINFDSNEFQKLYLAYFGRPGDPSGINYWLSRNNQSIVIRDISHELSRQDEYIKYIPDEKSVDFLSTLGVKAMKIASIDANNFHF